jgi:nucleotide-binding universal stress UspA family protein
MISKILIPTDFSSVANNALDYAIHLAQKTNASLHLLHVNNIPIMDASFPNEVYQTYTAEIEDFAKKSFENIENLYLNKSNLKFETHTAYGFVNDEIQEFAKNNDIDLIVLGTTGASGIQEILECNPCSTDIFSTDHNLDNCFFCSKSIKCWGDTS